MALFGEVIVGRRATIRQVWANFTQMQKYIYHWKGLSERSAMALMREHFEAPSLSTITFLLVAHIVIQGKRSYHTGKNRLPLLLKDAKMTFLG